jgi:DNA-binding NtrC family response regulator
MQVKLLRVLQEREFERVGGTETLKVDVRFVAATHKNLEEMIAKGSFREDLFYRLNVVPVHVPPLHERQDDVRLLATHFVSHFGALNGRPDAHLLPQALDALAAYSWPGNVRQLQNIIERLVVLSDGDALSVHDVARELTNLPGRGSKPVAGPPSGSGSVGSATLDDQRRGAEREALLDALARAKNNRTLAARLLNVSRRTLYNKLEELGIE